MKRLHREFLGKNEPTDVLAFGQDDEKIASWNEKPFLGDVVISVETAKRRAPEFGNRWDEELLLYLCHGLLHLMGIRDSTRREKKKMRAMEETLLRRLLGTPWRSKKPKRLF